MGGPQGKGYKRSWKNLLLNKRYQLRFTLFMVITSAILMTLLGWWVMTVANRATTVSINNVLGEGLCGGSPATAGMPDEPVPADPPAVDVAPTEPTPEAEPPKDDAKSEDGKSRPIVTIEESTMELTPPPPKAPEVVTPEPAAPDAAATAKSNADCKARQIAKIADLKARNWLIFWVLVATGTVLVLGLLVYGIKMTHKVAGPLFKVQSYMAKLKDGKYDKVYNLRKGDQLMEFYEHFKQAHAGMTKLQQEDVERLKALLAAADKDQLAGRSPEVAAALEELRALLDRKEKSLG